MSSKLARRAPKKPKNLYPVAIAVIGGVCCLNLLLCVGIFGAISYLADQPPPRLVETVDGSFRNVIAIDEREPSPEVIRQFVAETLYGLYDWRGVLPPESAEDIGSPKPDPGVPVKVNNRELRITTTTWRTGFRLQDDIRPDILRQIAQLTPQTIFAPRPTAQMAITTPMIGQPIKVEEDLWEVDYTAILLKFANGDNLGEQVLRDHEIFVRQINPLTASDPAQLSDLQKTIWEERRAGLVIESMPQKIRS